MQKRGALYFTAHPAAVFRAVTYGVNLNRGDYVKPRVSCKKVILIVLGVLLALILAAMIFITAYWKQKLNLINYVDPDGGTTLSSEEIQQILDETDPTDPDFTGPVLSEDEVD